MATNNRLTIRHPPEPILIVVHGVFSSWWFGSGPCAFGIGAVGSHPTSAGSCRHVFTAGQA